MRWLFFRPGLGYGHQERAQSPPLGNPWTYRGGHIYLSSIHHRSSIHPSIHPHIPLSPHPFPPFFHPSTTIHSFIHPHTYPASKRLPSMVSVPGLGCVGLQSRLPLVLPSETHNPPPSCPHISAPNLGTSSQVQISHLTDALTLPFGCPTGFQTRTLDLFPTLPAMCFPLRFPQVNKWPCDPSRV